MWPTGARSSSAATASSAPNPYDPDPHAPAIYFHWLTWIFGVLSVPLGLDPGLVYVLVGLTAAVVFSRLTLELVRRLGLLAKLRPRALGVPLLLLLACADNLAFLWSAPHGEAQETAVIDSELRAIYRTIEEANLEGVLLSNDELAAYLAATYTPARPYLGHWANTPDMEMRHAQMREFFETGRADDWIEGIDLLLLRGPLPVGNAFSAVVLGERWSLYRRW